jgi:hypothetical protein
LGFTLHNCFPSIRLLSATPVAALGQFELVAELQSSFGSAGSAVDRRQIMAAQGAPKSLNAAASELAAVPVFRAETLALSVAFQLLGRQRNLPLNAPITLEFQISGMLVVGLSIEQRS